MQNNYIYTVTQLNNHTLSFLRSKFTNIWVKGEVSALKKYPSGYTYFTLKDNKSQVSCITKNDFDNIDDGARVTINADVDLYIFKGNYQLKVHSIFPTGKGELWMNYIAVKNKLEAEGFFDIAIKKELPLFPKVIGIITSLNGSVIKDIQNIVNRRAPYIRIIVRDSKVNGIQSSNDLINGIQEFIEFNNIDLIIMARGGGSFEDLMGFNDEMLVRSIYDCHIPIISAVGHETDFTLCDFVSDVRASTPSEAAEISCSDINELKYQINNLHDNIHRIIKHKINQNKIIISKFLNIISSNKNHAMLSIKNEKIKYLFNSLNNNMINKIHNYKIRINLYKKIFASFNLEKIKKMGFSLIKKDSLYIKNINELNINDLITIEIENGFIKSKVKELYEKK